MAVILLVEDHPLYHEGLASAFTRLAPDLRIVSAGTAEEGLRLLKSHGAIDLALIDLVLPTADGFEALRLYGEAFPHIPRVLISGKNDGSLVVRACAAGASGFIPKAIRVQQLIAALRCILAGDVYFNSGPPDELLPERHSQGKPLVSELSLRQLEVLRLLGEGRTNKEMARLLAIADRTVRAHLTELFRTLGVSNRMQAILTAQRLGLLHTQ